MVSTVQISAHPICQHFGNTGKKIGDGRQEIINAEVAMAGMEFPTCERKWVILSAVALPALGAIAYWLSHNYLSTPQ